jgi:hypothetical protein
MYEKQNFHALIEFSSVKKAYSIKESLDGMNYKLLTLIRVQYTSKKSLAINPNSPLEYENPHYPPEGGYAKEALFVPNTPKSMGTPKVGRMSPYQDYGPQSTSLVTSEPQQPLQYAEPSQKYPGSHKMLMRYLPNRPNANQPVAPMPVRRPLPDQYGEYFQGESPNYLYPTHHQYSRPEAHLQ